MKDESAYFIMVLYYYFTYFYLLTLLQKAIATTIVIMGLRLTVSYMHTTCHDLSTCFRRGAASESSGATQC